MPLSTVPAKFSDDFIDMIPPGEFEMRIDCEQQDSILKIKYQNAKLRKSSPQSGDSTILIFNL